MKITYNKNPLNSTVELDENEKKELWYKIKVKEMEDMLFSAHFSIQEGKFFNLDRAREELEPEYYCTDEKSKLDERCDMLLTHYLEELQSAHCGDCTCVPCSCSKCHAEYLLGIDTIPKIGKHSAYKIDGAFGKNNEKTMDEALDSLKNYEPIKGESWNKFSQADFDSYIPRWKAEAKQAYDWLLNYNQQFILKTKKN